MSLKLWRVEETWIRFKMPDGRVIRIQVRGKRKGQRCDIEIDAPQDVKVMRENWIPPEQGKACVTDSSQIDNEKEAG